MFEMIAGAVIMLTGVFFGFALSKAAKED